MLICRCGGRGDWDAPTDEIRCVECGAVLASNSRVANLAACGSVTFGPADAVAYVPIGNIHVQMPTKSFMLTSIDTTPEQEARDMLDRLGMPNAQSLTAGDVVELANLIATVRRLEPRR